MIEHIATDASDIVELRASGEISGRDYQDVVVPAIEEALEKNDKIRLLYHLGDEVEGFSAGAILDDAKVGLRHWAAFERVAVVTDTAWVKNSIALVGFALPCLVQVFPNDELEDARRWLRESLGSIHFDGDDGQRLARVRLLGRLDPSAYRTVTPHLDAFIARHERIRLLLDLREFQGWEGIEALRDHFVLVRDHHRAVERVAVVGDRDWEKRLAKVVSKFIDAEVRHFSANELPGAEKWVTES
jgi:hypothetical protein